MFYADGKTEPKKGDIVLGAKIKGEVTAIAATRVTVTYQAPWDPKKPAERKQAQAQLDPATLQMVRRD